MKEKLQAILKYRLQQADESLKEADILYNSGGSFRSVGEEEGARQVFSIRAVDRREF